MKQLHLNEAHVHFPIRIDFNELSLNEYPTRTGEELLKVYAKYLGVSQDQVMVGNGSDALLDMLFRTFAQKGQRAIQFKTDFELFPIYTQKNGASKIEIPNEKFSKEEWVRLAKEEGASMSILSNPNNPLGEVYVEEDLLYIIENLPDIPVIIDEAYIELSDMKSFIRYIDKYKNLYVTRTLSKAFALPGIRCGFLISNLENILNLRPMSLAFGFNQLSEKVATQAILDDSFMKENVNYVKKERKKLLDELKTVETDHFMIHNSQTNFINIETPYAEQISQLFEKEGYLIKVVPNYFIRITLADEDTNKKVLELLKTVAIKENLMRRIK